MAAGHNQATVGDSHAIHSGQQRPPQKSRHQRGHHGIPVGIAHSNEPDAFNALDLLGQGAGHGHRVGGHREALQHHRALGAASSCERRVATAHAQTDYLVTVGGRHGAGHSRMIIVAHIVTGRAQFTVPSTRTSASSGFGAHLKIATAFIAFLRRGR